MSESSTSPLREAQERFAAAVPRRATGLERLPLEEALGRTLAEDLAAPEDLPPYPRAIVEGFLVQAAATQDAGEERPVTFRVAARVLPGEAECPAPGPGEAVEVATGSLVAEGPYAVVRMWEARREGDRILVTRPFPPGFFVEARGSELARGARVMGAGTVLGPWELGLLAALGVGEVPTARPPRVALFSCGDEVIPFREPLRPGAIRDSNAVMLAAAIREAGGEPDFRGIQRDDFDAFLAAARHALAEADMLVISGGTAAGGRDFVSDLLRELGELLVDGVPMRSGRPLIMGVAPGPEGAPPRPVVCVAGHPPEALRGFRLFGTAAIDRLLGRERPLPEDAPPPAPAG